MIAYYCSSHACQHPLGWGFGALLAFSIGPVVIALCWMIWQTHKWRQK